MEIKNKELMDELDNLLSELSEEKIASSEKLQAYETTLNNAEADDIPYEEFIEEYDNVETLNELISIAREL